MSDKKIWSRRDFLKTAGAGSLLAAAGTLAQNPQVLGADNLETSQVPARPFGKTGVNVSSLSLGGMFDLPSNQLVLKQAVKWGVTYWDTADCYGGGRSEAGIGQFFNKSPETRSKIFLVTKSDSRDPDGMTQLLDQSLERMNTDYIDLYFIHGLRDIDELNNGTKVWAEKAKAAGKIRLFGFSTHSNMEECMVAASKLGWIDGIMMSYNFRLMHKDRMKAAVEACTRAGIGLTAMKTQGGGSVSMESETELEMAGRFLKQGFSDKQARLMAVWENPSIASICSQMPNMTILMSNIAAALKRTSLAVEDRDLLRRYAVETSASYCAGCASICETTLPGCASVSDIMRYLMYYHSYGDHDHARQLYAQLSSDSRRRLAGADFSLAERRCPQGLAIGKLMHEAAEILA